MTKIIKVGGETYIHATSTSPRPIRRRIRYKRETRYGSILGRNARQRANLAEDRLKEIRFKSKLQKEKKQYEQDRKALQDERRQITRDKRRAFYAKIKSGSNKVYNANVSNPFTKKKKQQEQERQHNFRQAFESSRDTQ